MTSENIQNWLNHWHTLLGCDDIEPFTDPDQMAGVLNDLSGDAAILEEAFRPLPRAHELLERIRYCIGDQKQLSLYLTSKPLQSKDEDLNNLVVEALNLGYECLGSEVPDYKINIIRRQMNNDEMSNSGPLIEELGDEFIEYAHGDRGVESEAMQFLWETLYMLAASYEVSQYCMTPLCPDYVKRIDPMRPLVELWLRSAIPVVRWNDEGEEWVDVFVG